MGMLRMLPILLITCIVLDVCQSRKNKNNFSAIARTHQGYSILKKFILKIPQRISKRLQRSVCELPKDIGSCQDDKSRYYYDSVANKCKHFTYTGCRGNKNNFRSLSKCEKLCKI